MCSGCGKLWSALQLVWSTVYVVCGAAQLISGIFFLISIPALHLSCNIWTGSWNVIIGIVGGMLACLGRLSPRRQEMLLYMSVSILTVNCVNVVLGEWGLHFSKLSQVLKSHPNRMLIDYACFATRIATATVILASLLDSQFSFCSMQLAPPNKDKKKHLSNEQVSDIEYIIPRPKPPKPPHNTATRTYSQSWVFDASDAASTSLDSPYLKILENGTPKSPQLQNGDTARLIENPSYNPVVLVEEASDDSNSNGDRKLCHMRSFSRSASPVHVSNNSSRINLDLESIYRSRLNSGQSKSEEFEAAQPQQIVMRSVSPHAEKVQYASLMKELQRAIVSKKEAPSSSSSSKGSDAEFSKELEAALQLIQDLESPNTVDTPKSDPPEAYAFKGKGDSQSTSGYSSPSCPSWSSSSLSGDMAFSIHNASTGTIISLYSPPAAPRERSVTLVNISRDEVATKDKWNVRSLLRRKKQVPRLCPELEGAIIKSESLAYLSENELLARHQRNEKIQREIEERVIQQLGVPKTESNC